MALFLVSSHRHTIVRPGEVMAAPLKPHKVEPPLPQQGPPNQNASSQASGAFLTGPNAGDPVDIALDYIRRNKQALGLTDDDLADIVIKDRDGEIINSSAQAQAPNLQGPEVSEPVVPGVSPAVRDLPPAPASAPSLVRELNRPKNPDLSRVDPANPDPYDTGEEDPLVRHSRNPIRLTPVISFTFEGTGFNGYLPPDTVGDVGPNHYVQMVNVQFQIFDKSGNNLTGPTNINQLWSGQGNSCESQNAGDPIVLYDQLADRWLLTQLYSNGICAAVSQTPDPTGAYWLYQFPTPDFPDYFKFGVWPDAYYMSANESTYTAYAFDRTNMLAGNAATFQRFTGQNNLLLPSDLDGPTPPPANSPNYFYTFKDNSFHGGSDRIEVFEFHVDFLTPANSTFTLVDTIPVSAFTYTVCGFFNLDCIPQPGTAVGLEPASEWPMWRLQYRNFGTHETLVGNFTVDVGGDQAGIRWFELRKSGGNWTLYQEGTHAPDSNHRWMGSIAMDGAGDIALGYSVSGSSLFPSIRYATRVPTDTPGTLQTEQTLQTGGGSQTFYINPNQCCRWGDYSSMNVDPTDDCTFWYTTEYYSSTSSANWRTRIGAFKVSTCSITPTPPALEVTKTANPDPAIAGGELTYILVVTNKTTDTLTGVTLTDTVPMGTTYSDGGTESGGVVQWNLGTMAPDDVATRTFKVTVDPLPPPIFFDDMESGAGNWIATGLWHLEDDGDTCGNSFSPTTSFYYGNSNCEYQTGGGSGNSGQLTTASSIALPSSGNPALTFKSWEQTENFSGFDTRRVFISTDGTSFAQIFDSSNNDANWYEVQLNLSAYAGQNIWLRFEFDTVDNRNNKFTGWYIDDVQIDNGSAGIINTASVVANEGDSDIDIIFTSVIEATSLTLTKIASPTIVQPGDPITYTVTFNNEGSGVATDVVISDQLPVTLTTVNVVSSGVAITDTGAAPAFVWAVQDLQPGEGGTITITGQISPALSSGGLFTNTAIISTTSVEANTADNIDEAGVTVEVEADVVITKTASSTTVQPGAPITYTITFSNEGSGVATGVVITDEIPVTVTDVNVVSSGVAITDTGGVMFTWAVQDLQPGEGGTITITGQISSAITSSGLFTNSAIISTTSVESDTLNNTDEAEVTIVVADLAISKTASPATVQPGDPITYTITLSNEGSGIASGVVITDEIPVTVTDVNVVSSGVAITDTGATPAYVWAVQDLQPGAGGTITITGQIDNLTGGGLYTNMAAIFTLGTDSDPSNDTAEAVFTVVVPNLILTKSVDETNPVPGEVITYTITVENVGTADAIGTVVSDTLPLSLTLAGPVTLDPPSAGTLGTPPLLATDLAISAGQSITITFPMTVSAMLSPTTVITNTAAVTSLVVTTPQTDTVTITVGSTPSGADVYLPLIVKDNP